MSNGSGERRGGRSRHGTAKEPHWLHVPDRPPPPKVYVEEHPSLASPDGPSPVPLKSQRPKRRRRTTEAVGASLLLHVILLWAAGTMVPGLKTLPIPVTPEMQVTLVEPIPPIEIQPPPLKLRELNEPDTAPPSTVPVLKTTPRPPALQQPKELARPTPPRQIAPLITPTAPIIPTPAPTPAPAPAPTAPPTPLPKLVKAPPTKLEDLNLHNTPTPAPQLRPQLTLPAPPSFGQPGGTPGSAAPGGGAPGVGAPGATPGTAANGQGGVIGNGGTNCTKAAMPLLSAAEQERCRVQAALQAAAALRKMQANDRNSSPLDGLADKRAGFNEERLAREERQGRQAAALSAVANGHGTGAVGKDNGFDASAGVSCSYKFGPNADGKTRCGIGFSNNGAPPKR